MQFKLTQFMVTAMFASAAMVQAYPAKTVSAREDSPSSDVSSDAASAGVAVPSPGVVKKPDKGNEDANTMPVGVITSVIDDKLPDSAVATLWAGGDAANHGKAGAITEAGEDCFNVPTDWNDSITSIHVHPAFQCLFYIDAQCSGAVVTVQGHGGSLQGTKFKKGISSYHCRTNPASFIYNLHQP